MEAVIINDHVVKHEDPIHMLPRLTRESVKYIESRKDKKKPFFLYVPLGSPHTPILPTKKWQGKSGLGAYGDFVMETDHVMGEIRKALKATDQDKNTLIIFTSDNGCSKAAGIPELAKKGHQVSANLRGSKADLWDGGHRIPFIVKWPGKVKEGSQSDQLICLTDLYATVADILNVDSPKKSCEDSESFLPALYGEQIVSSRKGVIHHSISGHFAYRMGKWKLLLARASGGWSSPRENQAKTGAPPGQLYDMSRDIEEQKNLYSEKSSIVQELLTHLKEDVERGRSTNGHKSSNDVEDIVLWKSEKKKSRK